MKYCVILAFVLVLIVSSNSAAPSQTKPYRGAEYRTIATMTYGRFEARMRSAQVSGMLATFFTYYDPANPWNEIDIETMGRYSNETQFNTIVPTQANNHVQRQILPFNPHAAFHILAIEWTPDYVAWRVDRAEVYRQTGAHIAQLVQPQKLMMNLWQPSDVNWAGSFNPLDLPVYAYYDWVKYYSYTPGAGDNFTLQWTDDFNSFDATRWQKATHTWDGNNSQFVQENVAFKDGYMILCLTDNLHSGYGGAPVVDADPDPPYVVSARASIKKIRVLFSEGLDKTSAENTGNYILPGATVQGASLLSDGRSVDLAVNGLNISGAYSLIVFNVKDSTGNAMSAKSTKVAMPLSFPIRIDVGGSASSGYLADSVWSFSSQYGAVGGVTVQQPPPLDVIGTTEDSLYRSALEGLSFYRVRVPTDMAYNVSLMLVETKFQAAGKRVFNVTINHAQSKQIDIYQQAGFNTAYQPKFLNVTAPDGLVDIYFSPIIDKAVVAGIIIEPIPDAIREGGSNSGSKGLGFDIYPNPFNGTTNFRVVLPQSGDVLIKVFDILGRLVSTVPLGFQERGEHSFRWDSQNLPSGTYVCAVQSGAERLTNRLLIVR